MMRILVLHVILFLLTSASVGASPGIGSSKLAEELATATDRPNPFLNDGHRSGGFKSLWPKLRSKFLHTKTSERWLQTFASDTPRPSTQTATASSRYTIPNEDALISYAAPEYRTPRASTDEMTRKTDPRLWTRYQWAATKMRAERSEAASTGLTSLRTGQRGREAELRAGARAVSTSPRLKRPPPKTASPRAQRGREVEIMPGASPRVSTPEIVESRRRVSGVDSPSMRRFRFSDDDESDMSATRTDNKLATSFD